MPLFALRQNNYEKLDQDIGNNSINSIAIHLGYNTDQTYTYVSGNGEKTPVNTVVLEIFSNNVIFVYSRDEIDFITQKDVDIFMENWRIFRKLFPLKSIRSAKCQPRTISRGACRVSVVVVIAGRGGSGN